MICKLLDSFPMKSWASDSLASSRMDRPKKGRCCHLERLEAKVMLAGDSLDTPLAGSAAIETSSLQGYVLASGAAPPASQYQATGIASVQIELLNEVGVVVDQTATDSTGKFYFGGIPAGLYAIQELSPANYASLGAERGNGGGIVFNPDLIGEIYLEPGVELTGYNFFETAANDPQSQTDHSDPSLVQHTNVTFNLNGFVEPPDSPKIAKPSDLGLPATSIPLVRPNGRTRVGAVHANGPQNHVQDLGRASGQFVEQKYHYDFDSVFDEILLQIAYHQEDGLMASDKSLLDTSADANASLDSSWVAEPSDHLDQSLDQGPQAVSHEDAIDLPAIFVSSLK